ncbi:MAG: endonuclease [Planctomycetaceae bacterium]|nr:endonuclease [Planctomycetaceae bacterium]
MTPPEFRQVLLQTFADRRLSRNESQALAAALADVSDDAPLLGALRRTAFEVAGEILDEGTPPREIIDWLEGVTNSLAQPVARAASSRRSEACFSPGDDCVQRIRGLFQQARSSADVCVFTITDDRLSEVILDAHARGVAVRILTDNEKSLDVGSDITRFSNAGIATRIDATEYHMHHKFAIFDRRTLITGSYNWTRSAAEYNEENLLVTYDASPLAEFQEVFDRLWARCSVVHAGTKR